MANKNIKGLTVEIGADTTKLGDALADVDKKSRDLSSELGQINKLLKLDPGNTELLAQKQKVLGDAVSNTRERLDKLKEAEKQVQEQFERGEVSEEQVRALQREIIETERKMNSYEKAAEETADAVKELGKKSDDAAKEIDDVGDAADETEKEADELGSSLDGTLSAGLTAVIGLATAASAAIIGCVEASHEYRTAMGKLETAFADNNMEAETAKNTYKELQSILGETDQAVEASNFLAKLADNEEELKQWTEALTGVYATFGASLPIEGLAEAANETAKNGQVTGALADALNWAALEGETFGVTLKDNIEFTKKSQKEIDAMTDEQRASYEATKEQYEATEAYNKSVEEAASAEDYFNLALEACTDEQERQDLILKTLTGKYKKAGDQYKETNKEVIEANKANEEWNETVAEIGGEMAPVVTEIKKFGTSLVKNAKEPLKDVADFIIKKAIPALKDISDWAQKNGPIIKGTLVGIATALVAYKTATIAAEVAQKGLKGAILATEAAQKLLNIAQAATPMGLVTVAVAALTAGLIAYYNAARDAKGPVDVLTEEEKELATEADKAAQAFRNQKKATDEALADVTAEVGYTQTLANELMKLASASGHVKEKDQERVNFILNELNEALGTEYTMTDGVIQKYGELKRSIDDVIQSKLANALLETAEADYITAQQNKTKALENLMLKEKEYEAQQQAYAEYYAGYIEQKNLLEDQYQQAQEDRNGYGARKAYAKLSALEGEKNQELGFLNEKKEAYDKASAEYGTYSDTIMNYEEAQTAALSGNYDRAVDILQRKGGHFHEYSDEVDEATRKAVDALYQEAIDAGLEAERTKKNFTDGVEGYTEEMVEEARKSYQDALDAYANAYADAEGVGKDLGDGLSNGMETKRFNLISKAKSLVSGIISAMKKEADSNSPSKKTMNFGEDLGEGTEIGIEKKTKDVAKAATRQVGAVLDAYRADQLETGQMAARSLTESQTAHQVADRMAAASLNTEKLDAILKAIKDGQVLTIDGNVLVGATAEKMDSALGQRRALVARGAI